MAETTDAARAKRLREIADNATLAWSIITDLRSIADRLDAIAREPVTAAIVPPGAEGCPFCGAIEYRRTDFEQTGNRGFACMTQIVGGEVRQSDQCRITQLERRPPAPVPAPAGECGEKAWAVFGIEGNIVSVWLVEKSAKLTAENFEGATVAPVLVQRLDREPAAAQSASPAVEKQPEPENLKRKLKKEWDEISAAQKENRAAAAQPEADEGETCKTCGGEGEVQDFYTDGTPSRSLSPCPDCSGPSQRSDSVPTDRNADGPGISDGWHQTVTVEADGSRTRRVVILPMHGQEIEFETNDFGVRSGRFENDEFVCQDGDTTHGFDFSYITRWRPQPEKPETKETTELPEFVRQALASCLISGASGSRVIVEHLAALFRFPHDPPISGDSRLVVETVGIDSTESHTAEAQRQYDENVSLIAKIAGLEASRAELLRLLKEARQNNGSFYAWCRRVDELLDTPEARAAIAEAKEQR